LANGHSRAKKTLIQLWRWRPVPLAKFEIDFKHVNELLTGESEPWCRGVFLQYLFDLFSETIRVAFQVGSPFGGNPIQLKLGVLKRDMRNESGAQSSDEVAGNILEVSLGMILSPYVKEDRLNVRAFLAALLFFTPTI
jgi:hypothetical protein